MADTPSQTSAELERALRRVAQLETALMRRTELVEQYQTALKSLKASQTFQLVRAATAVVNKILPPLTRRREAAKSMARSVLELGRFLAGKSGRVPPTAREDLGAKATDPWVYRRWQKKFEPDAAGLARQRAHAFGRAPTISVVVPVFNTPAKYLDEMVQSVLEQTYPHWELCLADGASREEHVWPLLERYARADQRIKIARLQRNEGIVGNSNAALDLASGEFVALLDHDDTLAPFALFEVVAALQNHPDADLIYSDEDKLDAAGDRCYPAFKPAWSPETLLSYNYICHLTVMRRSVVEAVGRFRPGYDGAQDHDLVLRVTEKARDIVHVPKVLYHWRIHSQSTAANSDNKSYANSAGMRAIEDAMKRRGVNAAVQPGVIPGTYRVAYRLATQPLVSVIIPNRDQPALLSRCLESLAAGSYANYEVLILENNSELPETFAFYRQATKQPHVRVLSWEKPFNYSAVNNYGAAAAKGELLLFLNNDIEGISPDWLERMATLAVQPAVGAVGAKLYFADETVQHAGVILGMGGIAGHSHLFYPRTSTGYEKGLVVTRNCTAVTGACLLVPRAVFEAVGGFDEGFPLAFNDIDICMSIIKHGYRVVWTPDAELYHLESATRGPEDTIAKQQRFHKEIELFRAKWEKELKAGDPFYSPNLRLDRADFMPKT